MHKKMQKIRGRSGSSQKNTFSMLCPSPTTGGGGKIRAMNVTTITKSKETVAEGQRMLQRNEERKSSAFTDDDITRQGMDWYNDMYHRLGQIVLTIGGRL